MNNIYLENLQLILNSEITEEEKQKQLLELIESIENDLLLTIEERKNLVNKIENTDIILNFYLNNLKKLRNYAKKDLFAFSSIGLPGIAIDSYFTYVYLVHHDQFVENVKNIFECSNGIANFSIVILLINTLIVSCLYCNASYEELQEYLSYNKKINSYQRRLKDNHK